MRRACWVVYSFLSVLLVLSYWYIYPVITATGPSGKIIISNLTLNLVLVSCLLGGTVPYFVRSRHLHWGYAFGGFIIIAVLWLSILKVSGVSLRW